MVSHRIEKLNSMLEDIKNKAGKQAAKKVDIEMYKRLLQKLDSFSSECGQCEALLTDIENDTTQLASIQDLSVEEAKAYDESFTAIREHLEKEHKLVAKGHYQTTYMSIGLALGAAFGLLLFDNIGMGIGLGIALGISVGAGLDADSKKKGLIF